MDLGLLNGFRVVGVRTHATQQPSRSRMWAVNSRPQCGLRSRNTKHKPQVFGAHLIMAFAFSSVADSPSFVRVPAYTSEAMGYTSNSVSSHPCSNHQGNSDTGLRTKHICPHGQSVCQPCCTLKAQDAGTRFILLMCFSSS